MFMIDYGCMYVCIWYTIHNNAPNIHNNHDPKKTIETPLQTHQQTNGNIIIS